MIPKTPTPETTTATTPRRRFYRLADLRALGFDFHVTHFPRLERAGHFPKRVKLNPGGPKNGAAVWLADEVDALVEAIAERRPWQAGER